MLNGIAGLIVEVKDPGAKAVLSVFMDQIDSLEVRLMESEEKIKMLEDRLNLTGGTKTPGGSDGFSIG